MERDLVYLSYASLYDAWRRELRSVLLTDRRIELWDDLCLEPSDWERQIEEHVERARVMVMLVGPEYLHPQCGAAKVEIPRALAAKAAGEVEILWIPAGDMAQARGEYPGHPVWKINSVLPLERPVHEMTDDERGQAWRTVRREVLGTLDLEERRLVVLVPGHHGDPAKLAPLTSELEKLPELSGTRWLPFDYREPLWSNRDPEQIAVELGAEIQAEVERDDPPTSIILAGHSMGTTLLRRAFLNAKGYGLRSKRQSWAEEVTRMVLLGAIGRGFSRKRLPLPARPFYSLAKWFGLAKMRRAVMAGADFVTRLRLDWIRFNTSGAWLPPVIHLLGTRDPRVLEEDVIDIEQFANAIPIEIPGADHRTVIEVTDSNRHLFGKAFTGRPQADRDVRPAGGADRVVFLLHGIRDSKECFDAVAEKLREAAQSPTAAQDLTVIEPQYRRMSALAFVSPWRRRRHIPWFVDQYAEYLARNPSARFAFAGHSNGTYILGESLRRMPQMRFERVYVGACVLPPDYDWDAVLEERRQVGFVRSDRASTDWAVGILARSLNKLRVKDVGSGGYDRFHYGGGKLSENLFEGGHSAMLVGEDKVESIASFLLQGKPVKTGDPGELPRPGWFKFGHDYGDFVLPVILAALVLAIFAGGWLLASVAGWPVWAGPLAGLGGVALLWLLIERF